MSSSSTAVRAWEAIVRRRPTPEHVHGTRHGYAAYGCRCAGCRSANARHSRKISRRYRAITTAEEAPK